jgi:hypothetical protein
MRGIIRMARINARLENAMLWLIWIVLIVLIPILAGLGVWRQLRQEPRELPAPISVPHEDASFVQ